MIVTLLCTAEAIPEMAEEKVNGPCAMLIWHHTRFEAHLRVTGQARVGSPSYCSKRYPQKAMVIREVKVGPSRFKASQGKSARPISKQVRHGGIRLWFQLLRRKR
jgi:hypothetical protein